MSQNKYKKWIKELKEVLSTEVQALEALTLIESKLPSLKIPAKPKTCDSGFVIPEELLQNDKAIALYSDGACRGNPGPGAWGSMGMDSTGNILFSSSGFEHRSTNNIMELVGAIEALKCNKDFLEEQNLDLCKIEVFLYSDSKYVVDGIQKWVPGWKKRGWRKADKKEPENLALWKELDLIASAYSSLQFLWVKGHSGHPQNDYVDQLANTALDEAGF